MTASTSAQDADGVRFRKATTADIPALRALIALSSRTLGLADYSPEQIEAALKTAWGVDSQLIADQTYFVGEHGSTPVVCGGWSYRKTLFGADAQPGREPIALDPAYESARIRAFFVHPDWARKGLGRELLELCEAEVLARGFRSAELVATLPGERLYRAGGYQSLEPQSFPLNGGLTITFVPMWKRFG